MSGIIRNVSPAHHALPAWDEAAAVIDSLVSARRFQLQTDRVGAVRVLCREGEVLREAALAELIAEARGSAARLQANARDRAFAALASGLRRAIADAVRPALVRALRSLRGAPAPTGRVDRPVTTNGAAGAAARRT